MKSLLSAALISLILILSCGKGTTENPEYSRTIISERFNRFGFELFSEECAGNDGENIFISPASVSFALSMAAGGSSGETKEAMYRGLELSGIYEEDIRTGSRSLLNELAAEKEKLRLAIANSIWLKKGVRFREEFIKITGEYFLAESYPITDAGAINGWVDDNTGGRINKIIDSISTDDIAFLINAVYFKGMWKSEFDPEQTSAKDFHPAGGDPIEVDMMRKHGDFMYMDTDNFSAVSIPYGDGEMSIYLFLPGKESKLESFMEGIDYDWWRNAKPLFEEREGTVELPRLKLEYRSIMNEQLKRLGMGIAFSPREADFSRMCSLDKGNVYISEVLHKTFLKVNEEGTEAAAVTSVRVRVTSANPARPAPFHIVFDRPFFMAIADEKSGLILFMGKINLPPPSGTVE